MSIFQLFSSMQERLAQSHIVNFTLAGSNQWGRYIQIMNINPSGKRVDATPSRVYWK